MFPALVNCCTIDWFLPWPREALKSVAEYFLSTVPDLPNLEGVVDICVDMQERVHQPYDGSDAHGSQGASVRASARLSAALTEARRLDCRSPQLLHQAEALLLLLERAAVEQHERERSTSAALDRESERRAALVHRIALHRFSGAPAAAALPRGGHTPDASKVWRVAV